VKGKSMAWAYLAAAAVFEIIFALSMKYANGVVGLKVTSA
jgi:multidrug transporter EmrE-like cation transporter